MRYNPHDYQIYAINFIKEHPIAAILLDMGMGKTSIVLAALNDLMFDSFEVTKVLIIAPLRVAKHTWSAFLQYLQALMTANNISGSLVPYNRLCVTKLVNTALYFFIICVAFCKIHPWIVCRFFQQADVNFLNHSFFLPFQL